MKKLLSLSLFTLSASTVLGGAPWNYWDNGFRAVDMKKAQWTTDSRKRYWFAPSDTHAWYEYMSRYHKGRPEIVYTTDQR